MPLLRSLTIPETTLPSWNTLYAGMHWSKRKQLADTWHDLVGYGCKERKLGMITTYPVHIVVSCYFGKKGKLLDADNICAKIAIDGLKDIVLLDDDARYVSKVTTETHLDTEFPRTTIEIYGSL